VQGRVNLDKDISTEKPEMKNFMTTLFFSHRNTNEHDIFRTKGPFPSLPYPCLWLCRIITTFPHLRGPLTLTADCRSLLQYFLTRTSTRKFFCFTNQRFSFSNFSPGPSVSMKSKRRTNSGTSLAISIMLMLRPMHVRLPTPNWR
jgi:hypothetical protein